MVGFSERISSVFSCSSSEKGMSIIVAAFDLGEVSAKEVVVSQLSGCEAAVGEAQGWEKV